MAFKTDNKSKGSFSKISIGLASPEEILKLSTMDLLVPASMKNAAKCDN